MSAPSTTAAGRSIPWPSPLQDRLLNVHALTPLLFRDARPFSNSGAESWARSLLLPNPGTLAGFLRTLCGDHWGVNWQNPQVVRDIHDITVYGYLLQRTQAGQTPEFMLPAPLNAVNYRQMTDKDKSYGQVKTIRLTPTAFMEGEQVDFPPGSGLLPLLSEEAQDVKPERGYELWRWKDVESWLCKQPFPQRQSEEPGDAPGSSTLMPQRIEPPALDERVHVALEPCRLTAQEGMLYTVQYRALETGNNGSQPHATWTLLLRGKWPELPQRLAGHLGGERRPIAVEIPADQEWLQVSQAIEQAVCGSREETEVKQVCFMLVTPAIFGGGWKPQWLDEQASGCKVQNGPRGIQALAGAKLMGAAVGKPQPVSGWSYEHGKRGPKATRRMAPAGSVYFLELKSPLNAEQLKQLWLSCLSDEETDRKDGYGMAVWGVW